MERSSRHAAVDLHQTGAGPSSVAQIGHEEVRPLTLARAENEAGRKIELGRRKCHHRLLRFVPEIEANDSGSGQHGHIEVSVHVEGDAVPHHHWKHPCQRRSRHFLERRPNHGFPDTAVPPHRDPQHRALGRVRYVEVAMVVSDAVGADRGGQGENNASPEDSCRRHSSACPPRRIRQMPPGP